MILPSKWELLPMVIWWPGLLINPHSNMEDGSALAFPLGATGAEASAMDPSGLSNAAYAFGTCFEDRRRRCDRCDPRYVVSFWLAPSTNQTKVGFPLPQIGGLLLVPGVSLRTHIRKRLVGTQKNGWPWTHVKRVLRETPGWPFQPTQKNGPSKLRQTPDVDVGMAVRFLVSLGHGMASRKALSTLFLLVLSGDSWCRFSRAKVPRSLPHCDFAEEPLGSF